MAKLLKLLQQNRLTLIVELPKLDFELAEAAIGAGADALQIKLPGEKNEICRLVDSVKQPVGLGCAKNLELDQKILELIASLDFDFLNLGVEHLTPEVISLKISKVISLNSRFSLEEIVELSGARISALDAAIISSADKGRGLTVGDLQNYISIVIAAGLPVIIPTQRAIQPSEVAIIADTGAKGLLLTSAVTGSTAKHLAKAVAEFRLAINALS